MCVCDVMYVHACSVISLLVSVALGINASGAIRTRVPSIGSPMYDHWATSSLCERWSELRSNFCELDILLECPNPFLPEANYMLLFDLSISSMNYV